MTRASEIADDLAALRARRTATGREAWQRGQAALGAGCEAMALRWLDRAARLVPGDQTLALTLALLRLRLGVPGQAEILAGLAARFDLRIAWLGLAEARRREGDAGGAAAALGRALSGHVGALDGQLAGLAETLAAASGAPGWCAVTREGTALTLLLAPGTDPRALRLTRDGAPLRLRFAGARARLPARGESLALRLGGADLLGSPIRLAALRRISGVVWADQGGLAGWAWHPAEPDRLAELVLRDRRGRLIRQFLARDETILALGPEPLARPRGFRLGVAELAEFAAPFSLASAAGENLLGSPLDPGAALGAARAQVRAIAWAFPATPARTRAPAASLDAPMPVDLVTLPAHRGKTARRRRVAVVVPAYRDRDATRACLDTLRATLPRDVQVIVVDDASPEPDLVAALDAGARARQFRLLRLPHNRGFPAAANAGIRAARGRDVVLLNSDTLTAGNWLEGLRRAAYQAPDIATATPFSNDATILSYPRRMGENPVPDLALTQKLAGLAARANAGRIVDLPTAVGFCMYIRRDCLDQVGLLREDVFAQGYGEENDFCLRARLLGWRHVAATGVFVTHHGGASFGGTRQALMARNAAVLEALHPGYEAMIARFIAADPLAGARRRLDLARFRAAWARKGRARGAVLLITHDRGGGVAWRVAARIAALRASGLAAIELRGAKLEAGMAASFLADDEAGDFPNLRFDLPSERALLLGILRRVGLVGVEIHHLLGQNAAGVLELCRALALPYEVHVHDHAWLCPRVALLGAVGRYCGAPLDPEICRACVADAGQLIEEDIDTAALRARSAAFFAGAARVVVPSRDTGARLARHFPALRAEIVPWESDDPPPLAQERGSDVVRVVLAGAIGVEKGYDVLLACARDAARRGLALDFTVVGYTADDARLMATGKVFITGDYQREEAVSLLRAAHAGLGFLPSIVPETWCFTLSELWRAGLAVVAFDLGAQAERISATGRGMLLPPDLPAPAINDALLRAGLRDGGLGAPTAGHHA